MPNEEVDSNNRSAYPQENIDIKLHILHYGRQRKTKKGPKSKKKSRTTMLKLNRRYTHIYINVYIYIAQTKMLMVFSPIASLNFSNIQAIKPL